MNEWTNEWTNKSVDEYCRWIYEGEICQIQKIWPENYSCCSRRLNCQTKQTIRYEGGGERTRQSPSSSMGSILRRTNRRHIIFNVTTECYFRGFPNARILTLEVNRRLQSTSGVFCRIPWKLNETGGRKRNTERGGCERSNTMDACDACDVNGNWWLDDDQPNSLTDHHQQVSGIDVRLQIFGESQLTQTTTVFEKLRCRQTAKGMQSKPRQSKQSEKVNNNATRYWLEKGHLSTYLNGCSFTADRFHLDRGSQLKKASASRRSRHQRNGYRCNQITFAGMDYSSNPWVGYIGILSLNKTARKAQKQTKIDTTTKQSETKAVL